MTIHRALQSVWKDRNPVAWLLWPLSLLYCSAVEFRRFLYWIGLFPVIDLDKPVIVIGNLTVGGTGKTPLTIWLVEFLQQLGFSPGVVSRGYGRSDRLATILVQPTSDSTEVGDEPLLISRRTRVPVAVSKRRIDAIRLLDQQASCDIFVSDDGLQHLSIQADVSIALVDGKERFGNSFCLPAGPLRERSNRFGFADFRLVRGVGSADEYSMLDRVVRVSNILDPGQEIQMQSFLDEEVIAVAGIHNPQRFFDLLKQHRIKSKNIEFQDHHQFTLADFREFVEAGATVIMTEKDAVKCEQFAQDNWWYVAIEVQPDRKFVLALEETLSQIRQNHSI